MAEITEKSFPFDSEEIDGEYDRAYLADDFARYFREFITSGVFMKESTNLQIFENGDMTVTLKPGKMIIDGYRYDNTDDIIIQIEPADGVLNRIDRISVTWSKEDRDIHYTLQKGKPAYEPGPPECRRNADTKDYVLADVYISAGAIYITQADITDQRLNSAVCGIANPFNEVDPTSIFIQFTSWLKITKEKGEADVAELVAKMEAYLELLEISGNNQLEEILNDLRAWLDRMKGQLSEDAAGHLQVEIDELQEKLDEIETPDFDDSGEVEGINSFTDFMASFITGTSIYQFFANLKAGLKYVLHAGQLVNNGMCDTPGEFALDAAYGHTMTEQITQLYSDIADGINVRWNPESNRLQVNYNGIWVNYPPSFVGNSIYLIQDGICLVPYTDGRYGTSTQYDSYFETICKYPRYANEACVTFNKEISVNEPYELVIEAEVSNMGAIRYIYVDYSGSSLELTNMSGSSNLVYVTKRKQYNSGAGTISIRVNHVNGDGTSTDFIKIKNLYFRRIREE